MTEELEQEKKKPEFKIFLSLLNIAFCLVFAGLIVLYVNFGKILNNYIDEDFIKQSVKQSTGLVLNFNSPKIFTTKDFCINVKSDNITLFAPDDSVNHLLNIKNAEVKIKILPLLFKKIDFKKLATSDLRVNIVRDKNGKINFTKYIKTGGEFPFKITAKNANVLCERYAVDFRDNFIGEQIFITGEKLVSSEFDLDRSVEIKTGGQIVFKKGTVENLSPYALDLKLKFPLNKNLDFRDYKLSASVKNLDFGLLYPYVNEFVSKDVKTLKGKVTLLITPAQYSMVNVKLDVENFLAVIFKNEHNNSIDIPNKSSVSFSTAFKKDTISFKDFKFSKPGVQIEGHGTLKNLSNLKSINPDLSFKVKNSSLKEALKVVPDYLIKMQIDYIPKLKKYNADALVNGEIRIKDRFHYPNTTGKLVFKDVFVVERPKNAKTAEGSVTFKGDKVYIDVLANCPNSQYITVKGQTELKELPLAKFEVKSTPAVDLAFAHGILIPVQNILDLQLGPIPYMTLKGNGEVLLNTRGTRLSSTLNGYFKTNNGEATLQGLNTRFTNAKVNILFKDKKIIFDNSTGILEGAKARIDGNSDILGNLDLKFKVTDVKAENVLHIAKTSPMIKELLNGGEFLNAYQNPKGVVDFNLRIYGKTDPKAPFGDFSQLQDSTTLKSKGQILFKNNSVKIFPQIQASKIKGTLDFQDNVVLNLNADIYNSPFNITGTVSPDTKASKKRSEQPQIVDLLFKSKNVISKDFYAFFYLNQDEFNSKNKINKQTYDFLNKIKFKFALNLRAKGKVSPKDTVIDFKKFTLDGFANGMNYKGADVVFNSGDLRFSGQKIYFRNLNTLIWGANVVIGGNIDKIFDENFIPDLDFKLNTFPVTKIQDSLNFMDEKKVSAFISNYKDFQGALNGSFSYDSKGFSGKMGLDKISFYDIKNELPVVLNSGDVSFSNDLVKLNALNLTYGTTPIYTDAILENLTGTPAFNIFVTTNLNEESIDKLVNPRLQFPIKTKGELSFRGRLKGKIDNYTTFATFKLDPGADIYYMGANLGDTSNLREISSRLDFKHNEINIRNIEYKKFILSQNNKQTPYDMLKITGKLEAVKPQAGGKIVLDNFKLTNFRFITPNPAPARLLNLLFKKSVLKQGTFTSDILLEGTTKQPNALGKLQISNVDIPLYDSNVKDIDLDFKKDTVSAVFQGEGMGSDLKITAEILNKLEPPVVVNFAHIESRKISSNKLIEGLAAASKAQTSKEPSKQQTVFGPHDFEVKSGRFNADEILFNGAKATNFKGNFKHSKNAVFSFDNVIFDIAGGTITSSGAYEFDSATFTINSIVKDCDANVLASDLLGAKNQIYGNTNGKIQLTGRELNTANGINNIKARVDFAIYNGKMPKLGSLEYLLRAGNLIKSGILGFTINNVIEILIPYRTGEFERISGDFVLQDGKVSNLNIYSKGENLSIYTNGTYDILTKVGDFEVLGKLSTKISNLLGPVGNASVNSLVSVLTNNKLNKETKDDMAKVLDKIPDIGNGALEFRLFAVKILGDLNKEGYVRTFNWLN